MKLLLPFLLVAALILSCTPEEQVIYVNLAGNDLNEGSRKEPLKSLEQALVKAQGLRLEENKAVTILLDGGTYHLASTIQINAENAGSEMAPLKIAGYPHEQVTLSGARVLKAEWEEAGNGLMKAQLDRPYSFDQLFINGKKKVRARYPNFDPDEHIFNGYAEDATSKERVKGWENPAGGVLHAMHRAEWGGYHYQIEGKQPNGELNLKGGFQNNRQMGMHPRYQYVENIREELDSKGEWFLDQQENILYYYPDDESDLNQALIEVPVLDHLIEISGTDEAPAEYLTLDGLEFTHTRSTYMKTDEPLLRSDWTIYRGGGHITYECRELYYQR